MLARTPERRSLATQIGLCHTGLATLILLQLLPGALYSAGLDGLTIHSIQIHGIRTLRRETVLHYLGLEEGKRLSTADLNRGVHRLWSSRLIDDIEIDTRESERGVVLEVRIVERPVLLSVEYEGLEHLSRQELADLLDRERIKLHDGDVLRPGEVKRFRAAIENLYRERGYRFAEVSFVVDPATENTQRILFRIDEGSRVRVEEIHFEGNTAIGEARLRRAMKKTKQASVIARLLKRDVFKTAEFQNDIDAVRKVYHEAGYMNVMVGEPQILRSTSAGSAATGRHLRITIPIQEGQRFKLGETTIQGNEVFSDQLLLQAFPEPREEWWSSELIDQAVAELGGLYENRGYLRASVSIETVERPDGIADLKVKITEGDLYTVGRLEIIGNTKTRDKVVRREVRVKEGSTLNPEALRRSLVKIRQLGYFDLDVEEPVDLRIDEVAKTVDVRLQGAEANRTEVQFGASWEPGDDPAGVVSLSTRNFLGRGEALGFSVVDGGGPTESYSLFYSVPWLFDRPQQLGTNLFQQRRFFSDLTGATSALAEQGATLSYGRALGVFDSLTVAFEEKESQQVQTRDLAGDPLGASFSSTSLQALYRYDSRNAPLHPTHGTRFSGSLTYTGGLLGGDRSLVQPAIGFSLFRPLTLSRLTSVLALNTEAGWTMPFEGQTLFPLEGYFMGGPDSVRGFQPGSIFGRDKTGEPLFRDGLPVGGEKFVQVNLEYHLLMGGPVRLVLYADAGNAFAEDRSFDLSGLRYSAGGELRITIPQLGAPLRLIYANNLDPLPGDRFESFRFSFGTSF